MKNLPVKFHFVHNPIFTAKLDLIQAGFNTLSRTVVLYEDLLAVADVEAGEKFGLSEDLFRGLASFLHDEDAVGGIAYAHTLEVEIFSLGGGLFLKLDILYA